MRLHIYNLPGEVIHYTGEGWDGLGNVTTYETDDRGQSIIVELSQQDIENIAKMDPKATLYMVLPDSVMMDGEKRELFDRATDKILDRAEAYKRGENPS